MSDIIDAVLELAGDITFLTEDGLIDRKSVIDFLSGIENLDPKTKGSIVMYIESLPAVHPNHIADIGKKASISDNHENDCISRQAAIDIVRDKCKRIPTCAILAMDAIAKLPVALPEPKSPQNGSFDFEQPEIKSDRTTDDCISREAAIEALDEWFKKATRHPLSMSEYDSAYAQGEIDAYVTAIDTLKTLPSAQPDHVADVSKKVSISCGQGNDLISRQMAIDALDCISGVEEVLRSLPSAQPTLCGYNIEHLILIAEVLRKENLPPERVVEALTDIGRIVSIVKDEFEESLRKAVEQCKV